VKKQKGMSANAVRPLRLSNYPKINNNEYHKIGRVK
jgi:hypothetical protein